MNDNDKGREEIAKAYSAVQTHVLPGLGDAWDEAGPAVVLVIAQILADVWLESGFETFDLVRVINGRFDAAAKPASTERASGVGTHRPDRVPARR